MAQGTRFNMAEEFSGFEERFVRTMETLTQQPDKQGEACCFGKYLSQGTYPL
ncbi:MAG: hypothetical protein LBG43_10575 [Treponema sp.]|jgi:hypothetical protein|nr:hypothetical protein [Treponema sp.]